MSEITKEEAIAYAEVSSIFGNLEKDYYKKVPKYIVNFLKDNALKNYTVNVEFEEFSNLAKQILCYLNLEYWSTAEEKQELVEVYSLNQEKINEQYDISKIFEARKAKKYEQNNLETRITVKQTWLQKLVQKLKSIFRL